MLQKGHHMIKLSILEEESLTILGQIIMVHLFRLFTGSLSRCMIGLRVRILFNNLAHPDNVVAVHCNSGKGRTGTAIVCFLLFCGFFDNVADALKFYGFKRFTCGKGVS